MKTRIITGIILIALATFALFYSDISSTALALIISLGIILESYKMAKFGFKETLIGLLITGIIADITLLNTSPPFWTSSIGILISGLFLSLLATELVRKKPYFSTHPIIYGIRSGLIGIILFVNLDILFSSSYKSILVLTCIWMTDSGAYFVGKLIGKRKLSSLSPNKTIEGSIGGLLLGAILFSFLATINETIPLALYLVFPLGIILSLLSQIGDLHQSMTKRFFKVKDSSNILPGHGGIYDRCDSYLFTIPFFVLFDLYIL